ncbi:hypothetical protein TRFO_14594 [Tritrichomonas foetus]|uniref:Guanylate cyclase domain-containing protein n=1 Tax=Tritrichomonas foetus TaxID=1144522 RepID=A0A1J4KUK1_9EUKA|nr:hypothetical protein TRFO_14594 [Tritrichomonas foetus]|eukprot:OHT14947.1 hypothetical protein TRFO_14594 [Tritrichomonas foetus]
MNDIPQLDGGIVINHLNNITGELKSLDDINSAANQKKNLIDLKSYQGALMLLFNEMAQTNIYYVPYWMLQYVVPIVQLLIIIISPFIFEIWDENDKIGAIVRKTTSLLSFSPKSQTNSFDVVATIIISVIYLFVGLWFCIIPVVYLNIHQYPKFALYISVILSQVVTPFFVILLSSNISLIFTTLNELTNGSNLFFILLFIIIFILVIIGHTFLASMNGFLISPNPSPISSFKGIHPGFVVTSASCYIILIKVSHLFEQWSMIIVMVVHIALNVYFLYDTFQFPFVRFGAHVLAASLYTATIIGHILNIIAIIGIEIPTLIRVVVPYAFFIIGLISYFFVFKVIRHRIVTILSYTETQTDHDRREYYDSLNIKSSSTFEKMCRIGMSTLAPLYIDWTFPIYAGEMTGNFSGMISSALFVTFFPGEQQAASYFIEQISKQPMSSFHDRFILYRIKSTYLRRFSSDSEESTAAYCEATKSSENTLTYIREFWLKVATHPENASMRDLETIGRLVVATKRKWKIGLEQYPNDSRFPNGYSQFLLESIVDPENGVFMKLKSGHLQKGFNADIDPIFRAFGIARPFIFRDKICDRHGNIKRNAFEITSGTTVTISTTAMEKLEEDLDSGIIDKMIAELYHWPNLRKSFKRATSNYKPRFQSVGVVVTIIGVLAYIVAIIILLSIILPIFDEVVEYFDRIQSATTLRSNIALGKIAMMMNWARQIGILFTEDSFENYFPLEILQEPAEIPIYSLLEQVSKSMASIVGKYVDFSKSFNLFMATSGNTTLDVKLFSDEVVHRNVCNSSGVIAFEQLISLKNAISLLVTAYYEVAYTDIQYKGFATSREFCQLDELMRSITLAIDQGITLTRQSLINALDSNHQLLIIFSVVFIIIFTLVFFLMFHMILLIYYLDAKNMFNCILSLDPAAAKQGSELVVMTTDSNEQTDVIHATDNMSTYEILMIVLNIFFALAMAVCACVFFITTLKTDENSINFVDWSISGSKRISLAYEAFSQLTEAVILREQPARFTDFSTALKKGYAYLDDLIKCENDFFNGDNGIKNRFNKIDELHTADQCKTPEVSNSNHDFYGCLGIDQLLSTYVLYGKNVDAKYNINSTEYMDFFHMSVSELSIRMKESEELVSGYMMSKINSQKSINVAMVVLFLFVMIGLIFSINRNSKRLKIMTKMAFILFRRIPPPAIANCQKLKEIIIGPEKNSSGQSEIAQQVIFDSLPTAVLAVARDETIEAMNQKSKNLFGFLSGQIVGQKLECLIHKVDESTLNPNEEVSEEDAGSIRLYSFLTNMTASNATIYVHCHCSDDSNIRCEASLFPVTDFNGVVSNFILFLKETKDNLVMEANLKEAKEEVTRLMNQLIPSDVQGFIRGDRKNFSFLSKTVTVVAIQIYGFFDSMKKNGHKNFLKDVYKILQHLENGCIQFPPMMKQRQFTDIFIALGGLFNVTDDAKIHAQAAIQYATQMIEDTVSTENHFTYDFRIKVGIATGGPLICGLVGEEIKEFDAAGQLISDAIILAENATPSRILVSQETKDLLSDMNFENGTMIEGRIQSYWVPNFVEARMQMPTAASGSFIAHKSIAKISDPGIKTASILSQIEGISEDDDGAHLNEAANAPSTTSVNNSENTNTKDDLPLSTSEAGTNEKLGYKPRVPSKVDINEQSIKPDDNILSKEKLIMTLK